MLHVLVLGAAAGGGLPQWNCSCECCRAARSGTRGVRPQTQSSIAVSTNRRDWVVLNASPDIRQQLTLHPAMHPHPESGSDRHSPIAAVVLTNADIDHVAGLLTLRERTPFTLYATSRVHATLAHDRVFAVLAPDRVRREVLELERPARIHPAAARGAEAADASGQIEIRLFAVAGKVALYLEDATAPGLGTVEEDTVAVEVGDPETGRRLFYVPGCAAIDERLRERLRGAELILFDGTVYRDDEMLERRVGAKTGRRMGHVSISGAEGALARLGDLGIARRIFVHINNTNPIWLEDAPERRKVLDAGWEIAHDGMEIAL